MNIFKALNNVQLLRKSAADHLFIRSCLKANNSTFKVQDL